MKSIPDNTEKSLKPNQLKALVAEYLQDKRKSVTVFKLLGIGELETIAERLNEVTIAKKKIAKAKAERERLEMQKIDRAVSEAMTHLKNQGFRFNKDEVARLLSQKIKPGDLSPATQSDVKIELVEEEQSRLGEGANNVSGNVQ